MWHYPEGITNHSPVWSRHGIRILPGPSSLWLDADGHRLPAPLFPGFDSLGALRHITGARRRPLLVRARQDDPGHGVRAVRLGAEPGPDRQGRARCCCSGCSPARSARSRRSREESDGVPLGRHPRRARRQDERAVRAPTGSTPTRSSARSCARDRQVRDRPRQGPAGRRDRDGAAVRRRPADPRGQAAPAARPGARAAARGAAVGAHPQDPRRPAHRPRGPRAAPRRRGAARAVGGRARRPGSAAAACTATARSRARSSAAACSRAGRWGARWAPDRRPACAAAVPPCHGHGAPDARVPGPTDRFGSVTTRPVPLGTSVGRIPVVDVSPVAEAGRFPAKAVVGEAVPVRATVFREGHDAVAATAVLIDPDGVDRASARMVDIAPGLDRFEARLVPDAHRRTGRSASRAGRTRTAPGARRHDQGRGRRRRRAHARRGRPAARARRGAHGRGRDAAGGRPRARATRSWALRDIRDAPQRPARRRPVRAGARRPGRAPAARARDARRPTTRWSSTARSPSPAPGTRSSRARRARRTTPTTGTWRVRARCAPPPSDLPRDRRRWASTSST